MEACVIGRNSVHFTEWQNWRSKKSWERGNNAIIAKDGGGVKSGEYVERRQSCVPFCSPKSAGVFKLNRHGPQLACGPNEEDLSVSLSWSRVPTSAVSIASRERGINNGGRGNFLLASWGDWVSPNPFVIDESTSLVTRERRRLQLLASKLEWRR